MFQPIHKDVGNIAFQCSMFSTPSDIFLCFTFNVYLSNVDLFVYIWTQLFICIQEGMLLETQLLFYGGLGSTLSRVYTCSMCFLDLHGFLLSLEARMNRSINSVVQWFGCLSTRCDVLFPANTFGVRAPKSQFIFLQTTGVVDFLR